MDGLCRTCLLETNDLLPLSTNVQLVYKLQEITSIQLIWNLNTPTNICKACVTKIEAFFEFRTQLLQNENILEQKYQMLITVKEENIHFVDVNRGFETHCTNGKSYHREETDSLMKQIFEEPNQSEVTPDINYESEENYIKEDSNTESLNNIDNSTEIKENSTSNKESTTYIKETSRDIKESSTDFKESSTDKDNSIDIKESSTNNKESLANIIESLSDINESSANTTDPKKSKTVKFPDCDFKAVSAKILKSHNLIHLQKEQCHLCGKILSPSGYGDHIKRHIQTSVPDNEKETFACPECDYKTTTKNYYDVHRKRHVKTACLICGRLFSKDYMQTHLWAHSKETFDCPECGKTLKNEGSYKFHKLFHVIEKNICDVCGKSFNSRGEFKCHLNRHRVKKDVVRCKLCPKTFTRKRNFTTHMRSHTGEKPYTCETCGKKLSSSNALKVHKRQHTKEKPHVCKLCPMAFTQPVLVRRHMKSKHDVVI